MDEVQLAERLIAYDTSRGSGIGLATDFVAGWLEASGAEVRRLSLEGRQCLIAGVGSGTTKILLHGHLDVVPGHPKQFVPRRSGDKLLGRGAYDMKGALGAMMLALADLAQSQPPSGVRVELVVVPDEERAEPGANCTEMMVTEGLRGDFVICGEPTEFQVGVQAKGVLMLRADVPGHAAHGSTPWLGENAILRAVRFYEAIERLPFARESSELFDRPSVNLGRMSGGDAINKVPDACRVDIDIRYLPEQRPNEILTEIRGLDPDVSIEILIERPPAYVSSRHPLVESLLDAAGRYEPTATAVGRDGASDAVAFLAVGVPAVEFGPCGGGHHGPEEHVDLASLGHYRRALVDFVRQVPAPKGREADQTIAGGQ